MEKESIRLNRINPGKSIGRPDGKKRAAKYNYADMEDCTIKVAEGFAGRVMELRNARGVSGREMSLSLGQSAGYINNIENGNNLPSLAMFFEICEYLRVTPDEFFSYTRAYEDFDLLHAAQALSSENKVLLLTLAKKLAEADRIQNKGVKK